MKIAKTVLLLLAIIVGSATIGSQAKAQSSQDILNIGLRDSYGKPLSDVLVEVLSYDWGLQMGKPYAVIATGQTDKNGVVAFDVTGWPHSGYRFRFTKTDKTQPADAYFMPDSENQYRGYPAVVTGNGAGIDNEFFVIMADGLAYNDLANGQGNPVASKDPVGGLLLPRVSPSALNSQNYMATARSNTATAFADGVPTLTPPPPMKPFSGVAAAPLTITPIATTPAATTTPAGASTSQAGATTTSTSQAGTGAGAAVTAGAGTRGTTTPVGQASQPSYIKAGATTPATTNGQSDISGSLILAVLGIACFFLFARNKSRIYGLMGVDQPLLPELAKNKVKKVKQPEQPKAKSLKPGFQLPATSPPVPAQRLKKGANSHAKMFKLPVIQKPGTVKPNKSFEPKEQAEGGLDTTTDHSLAIDRSIAALNAIRFLAGIETYSVLILSLPAVLASRDHQLAEIDEEIDQIDSRLAELYLRRNDITAQFQAEQEKGAAA